MASEVEFWRQDPAKKAEGIAQEIERLSRRARAAGLSVTAYILGLAVEEARKEAALEDACSQLLQGHAVNRIIGPNETINAHKIKEWCAKHRPSPPPNPER